MVSGNTRFLMLVAGPTLGWLLLPAETRSGRRGGPEFQHHHGCGRCPGCKRLPLWDASLHYSPCTVWQVRGWAPAWKQKEQTNKRTGKETRQPRELPAGDVSVCARCSGGVPGPVQGWGVGHRGRPALPLCSELGHQGEKAELITFYLVSVASIQTLMSKLKRVHLPP